MTRLHFTVQTARDCCCPICAQPLVGQSLAFVDSHAFCHSCAELHDGDGRLYAQIVVAKRQHHRDVCNWAVAFGLYFYTPNTLDMKPPYMLVDPPERSAVSAAVVDE